MPSSLTWFLPSASVYSTCPPVSVCGTVHIAVKTLRRFSRRHGRRQLRASRRMRTPSRLGLMPCGFACTAPCALGPPIPAGGLHGLPRRAVAGPRGSGNVDPESIGYALRPRLRGRLTLGGRTWPRKPRTFGGGGIRAPLFVTHACMVAPMRSTVARAPASPRMGRSPTNTEKYSSASAAHFSPDHFRRGTTRPVSCYAIFKWWLPLSQHPGCPCGSTSFNPLNARLGALAGGPGCFPFDRGAYPPRSDSRARRRGIRSSAGFGIPVGTRRRSVALPPRI